MAEENKNNNELNVLPLILGNSSSNEISSAGSYTTTGSTPIGDPIPIGDILQQPIGLAPLIGDHNINGIIPGHRHSWDWNQLSDNEVLVKLRQLFEELMAEAVKKSDLIKKLLDAKKGILVFDPESKEVQLRDKTGRIYATKPLEPKVRVHRTEKREDRAWPDPGPMIGNTPSPGITYTATDTSG